MKRVYIAHPLAGGTVKLFRRTASALGTFAFCVLAAAALGSKRPVRDTLVGAALLAEEAARAAARDAWAWWRAGW